MKTVRCLKCGALYPIDMEMCPSCNTKNSVENIKRIDDTKGQTRAQGYWSTSQVKSITCCMCGKQAQWNNGLYRCECGAHLANEFIECDTLVDFAKAVAVFVCNWGGCNR